MRIKSKTNRRAFTLIELLVALSIAGIISLAVMSVLGSGLLTYDRIQSYGHTQTDVLLALEEMEKNLRNTFYFSEIPFVGDSQKIAFVNISDSVDEAGVIKKDVGKLVYYFDKDTQQLLEKKYNYALATSKEDVQTDAIEVLATIKSFNVTYYYFNTETKQYDWKDSWDEKEEKLPKGIKIALVFSDGQKDVEVQRIVLIPVG